MLPGKRDSSKFVHEVRDFFSFSVGNLGNHDDSTQTQIDLLATNAFDHGERSVVSPIN